MKTRENPATSIIETTREPLGPLPRRVAAAKEQTGRLAFRMQHQQHTNWCWAAVATSVAIFYNRKTKWTQCGVVNRKLRKKSCCGKHRPKCNKIGHLQESLKLIGHGERPYPYVEGKIPFSRARAEIDAGRPVAVRTQWRGSEIGHVLAIVGYHSGADGLEMLTVDDPTYGRSHVHYRLFCDEYRGSGQWTRSYYTKH